MRPATLVFLYALAVAWYLPVLLTALTARGITAPLGLTAWLAAMLSVLASVVIALQFLVRTAIAAWPGLAEAVCRSVAGTACTPVIYRSAVFELALAAAATTAAAADPHSAHDSRPRPATAGARRSGSALAVTGLGSSVRSKRWISHPRNWAMRRKARSGLTATGWPTVSSIGTSVAESL